MIGEYEQRVQMLVAWLQTRSEGVGMLTALKEAGDILAEARKRVGHGPQEGGCARGGYLTSAPVATLPRRG